MKPIQASMPSIAFFDIEILSGAEDAAAYSRSLVVQRMPPTRPQSRCRARDRAHGKPLYSVLLHHVPSAAPIFTSDGTAVVPTRDGLLAAIDAQGRTSALRLASAIAVSPLAAG